MGSASSQQKLPLKEIPPNIKTSSRYVLYLMFTYPEGSPDGPTPLWTGSLDEIIDEDLSSNTVLYGWGSSKPFIRKEVDKFVGSVRSREPGVTVRYRIVGPK
ncbi:uncharacterized protein L199_008496 [Kwoniella botswanensis]|uniref:uncharacterized protein n=1 Tax=Kwoniella botswanensis TaxID=1268659 RepID=UPI00315CE99A